MHTINSAISGELATALALLCFAAHAASLSRAEEPAPSPPVEHQLSVESPPDHGSTGVQAPPPHRTTAPNKHSFGGSLRTGNGGQTTEPDHASLENVIKGRGQRLQDIRDILKRLQNTPPRPAQAAQSQNPPTANHAPGTHGTNNLNHHQDPTASHADKHDTPPETVSDNNDPSGHSGSADKSQASQKHHPGNHGLKTQSSATPADRNLSVEDGTPLDRVHVADNLFAADEIGLALEIYQQVDVDAIPLEERYWLDYQTACCLRRLGRTSEAISRYRRLSGAAEAHWTGKLAKWWLDTLTERETLIQQVEQSRQILRTLIPEKSP